MEIFNKTFRVFSYYQNRDIIYKCQLENAINIPNVTFGVAKLKSELKGKDSFYVQMSALLLLFENMPYIQKQKKDLESKKQIVILTPKLTLTNKDCFSFFYRLKNENGLKENLRVQVLKGKFLKQSIKFKTNIFSEFLQLYDKFYMLQELHLDLYFTNCKNVEQKRLFLSSWINS